MRTLNQSKSRGKACLVSTVFPFVIGIITVQQLSSLPGSRWIVFLCLIVVFLALLRSWRLIFFVIGLLWAITFSSVRLTDRLPEQSQGQLLSIEGKVIGLPRYDERRVRFDFLVTSSPSKIPGKLRLSWFFPKQKITTGQTWRLTVKLKKPHGRFNGVGMDYERWLFMQNIGATGYIKSKPEPELLTQHSSIFNIDFLRQVIATNITDLLESSANIGLIKALTIGDRSDINSKQWDIFRKTGTVHLLAISGLHIGLIAGLVYFLVTKIALKFQASSPQAIAAIFAIIVAIFYAALAGFSLPTQRALVMITVAMLAINRQRHIKPVNTIALALFIILIFDPLAVLSAGFWLSFLAVSLIIYSVSGRLGNMGYWYSAIKIHWVTAIGLSPLLLFFFQQVSFIAPLANLVAVPVISFLIVPLCLIAVVMLFLLPTFSQLIYQLINSLLQVLWHSLSFLAEIPFASVNTASIPIYIIPLTLIGVLVLLAPKGLPAKWLGLVLFLPLVLFEPNHPKQGEVRMTLLDVGQGLATVVETRQHTLVFDTGAKYSEKYNMGDAVVIPFLQSKGINKVDKLIISHGDNDHIGGAFSLLEKVTTGEVLTSVPGLLQKYQSITCKWGQSWQWDAVDFKMLSPGKGFFGNENNNSCVLKISSKHGSILLTGDIEEQAENWLVNNRAELLNSDILIAPHHGSKTSSSLMFLKLVSPQSIIIPAGYRNRFSFPHESVIKRYGALNINWMDTANKGAIVVNMKNDVFLLNSLRDQYSKYWN